MEDAGIIDLVEGLGLLFVGVIVSSVFLNEAVVAAVLIAFVIVDFCVLSVVCVLDEGIAVAAVIRGVGFLAKVTDVSDFLVVVGNVVMVVVAMVGVANIILSSKEKRTSSDYIQEHTHKTCPSLKKNDYFKLI